MPIDYPGFLHPYLEIECLGWWYCLSCHRYLFQCLHCFWMQCAEPMSASISDVLETRCGIENQILRPLFFSLIVSIGGDLLFIHVAPVMGLDDPRGLMLFVCPFRIRHRPQTFAAATKKRAVPPDSLPLLRESHHLDVCSITRRGNSVQTQCDSIQKNSDSLDEISPLSQTLAFAIRDSRITSDKCLPYWILG
jgi:hypothetical protein